jgi:hypothetical protein
MSNVYMHSNPDPENLKGLQGKKNHTHAHKYSLKLSHTRAPTHTDKPALEAYFPAPHDVQLEKPSVAWNLPAVQLVQVAAAEEVDPSGPYLPAAHKEPEQVEGVVAPTAAEYLPASQSMQTAEPGVRPQRQTTGHFHVHVRNERRRLSCENGCALRIGWACKS